MSTEELRVQISKELYEKFYDAFIKPGNTIAERGTARSRKGTAGEAWTFAVEEALKDYLKKHETPQ